MQPEPDYTVSHPQNIILYTLLQSYYAVSRLWRVLSAGVLRWKSDVSELRVPSTFRVEKWAK
jgi:hypothetical protein